MTGGTDVADSPTLLLDRYRVDGFLGEGGLGTVVMAFDTRLKRRVAIKSLRRSLYSADPDQFRSLEERFTREAEAGSRMGSHPNLVTVHDFVTDTDKTLYLILEYVSGGTLAGRIKAGPLPLGDALRITAEAARGLQAAHDAGLVHRDIKPANIFLAADGRAQVGDFGIAQIDDLSARTHTTASHPGTPLYMSPEQTNTTAYVSPATDQFSLGLVLFEMLTGTVYRRSRKQEIAALLAQQPPPVAALIERMLAPDSDDRYPAIRDVATAIAAIERTLNAETEPPYYPAPSAPPGYAATPAPDAMTGRLDPHISTPPGTPPPPPSVAPYQPPGAAFHPAGEAGIAADRQQPTYPPPAASSGTRTMSRRNFLITFGGLATAGVAAGAVVLLRGGTGSGAIAATATPGLVGGGVTTGGQPLPSSPTIAPAGGTSPTATTAAPATATTATATAATRIPPTATRVPPTPTTILQPSAVGPTKGAQVQRVLTANALPPGTSASYLDIESNTGASVDPDHVYPAAALIDLFIITEAYRQIDRGGAKGDDVLPIRQQDIVGGTGVLQNRGGGTTTIKECIDLVCAESDNTAANLLINRFGMDAINGTIKTLGLVHTALRRHLLDTAAVKAGVENETSAGDMALFFAQLARGTIISRAVSTALVNAIALQNKPEWDFLGGSLNPRPTIVHMTGIIPPAGGALGILHDAGIFYPAQKGAYVLVFLNQSNLSSKDAGSKAGAVSQSVFAIAAA